MSYRDSGGLWRMGHEFRGGFFVEHARASQQPARIKTHVRNDVLEVRIDSEFDERRFVRRLWMRKNAPVLRMRLEGSARRGRTITCRFPTRLASPGLYDQKARRVNRLVSLDLVRPTIPRAARYLCS